MSSILLDLKKFKHIKSDDKSTTLQHKQLGHTITLHHNVLSSDNQKALKALSQSSRSYQTPLESDEIKHQNQAEFGRVIQKANGGEVPMAQGGNAGEQRKKIFGSQSSPSKPEMREKHMGHINEFAKKQFGMEVAPSGGKINPKTGERRDEAPEQGVDKPDWRSGKLESQSNPDAMMHELAHLVLLPKGVGLKKGQELMDKQYAEVQKKHGYMKQKRSQGEIQPMAAENILRRHIGLPPATQSVPVKEGEGPRMSVDTGELAGNRIQKGNKTVDLIRQSKFLSPENRQRLEHVISGHLKFHPEHGWQENPDALGAKTRLYKEEHPEAIKKKAMAEGGNVDSDPMSKIHAFVNSIKYAEGGDIEPKTFMGQEIYGTGVHKNPAPEHEGTAPSPNDEEWPLPSQTSVGKEIAAKKEQSGMAQGGEVKYNNPKLAAAGQASIESKHHAITPEQQQKNKVQDEFMRNTAGKSMQKTIHKARGGECYACGGPVQRYAEGDTVHAPDNYGGGAHYSASNPQTQETSAPIDDTPSNLIQNAPNGVAKPLQDVGGVRKSVPRMAEVPADQVAVQKIYNTMVNGQDPESMGNTNTRPWATFGPNGEPPKAFDANTYQQAEQQVQKQKTDASSASQDRASQIQQDNIVRQRAGLPPIPVPGQEEQINPGQQTTPQASSMEQPNPYDTMPALPAINQTDQYNQAQAQPNEVNTEVSRDPQQLLQTGGEQALQGIKEQGQAIGSQGQAAAAAYQANLNAQRDAQIKYKQHFDAMNAERQNVIQDINNGHIDPEHYWTGDKDGNGSHSKIAAGIGMILGGLNPTGSGNAAINYLKYQMDRDIDAQKTNLAQKNSLLYANLQQFHNLRDATDMTKIMQTDIMTNELQKAAATASTPLAKAAALQAAGKLQMELAPQMQTFAMRNAMMSLAGGGQQNEATYNQLLAYMRTVNPEYAKEMQSRIVPGVGVSPNQAIPEEVRNELAAKQELGMLTKDLLDYTRSHTNINPMSAEYKVGAAKAFNIVQTYRQAKLGGILRQGEMPILNKVLDANPANVFKELNSIPKLQEMMNLNELSKQNIMKSRGIVPWQGTEQQIQPQQKPVQGKDGKMYIRQGNFMIPVGQ